MSKRKSQKASHLSPLADPASAKAWYELDRAIVDWTSSDLGLELQRQNLRLFNCLLDNLRASQRLLYGPDSLKSAIISVSEIMDLEMLLNEADLSLTQIDSAFIDDITASWDLFLRYWRAEEHQAARKARYNLEVRKYDSHVKALKECPTLKPEDVALIRAKVRLPSTHDICLVGGFDESGPKTRYLTDKSGHVKKIEETTAFIDPPDCERRTFEELQALCAKDPRYKRLPKTFRNWPVWKDTIAAFARGWNRQFSKAADRVIQMKRVSVYSPARGGVLYHRKTTEAITKLLHLCFPRWFPDNREVTEGILRRL